MTPWAALIFWVSTFLVVFLLGFQSRSVHAGRYGLTALTSALIGTAQMFMVRGLANGEPVIVWALVATAGPAGITSAMFVYQRMFK